MWAEGHQLRQIKLELKIVSDNTLVDWASFCREVFLDAYDRSRVKLGGVGEIVEIDESKFGKRKYHRGHPVEGAWVFGGIQRSDGSVFMEIVKKIELVRHCSRS